MTRSTTEIRQAFLDFFHSKGHQIIPGSALVPENDPTLLFTNAGMNQFKDVFLGLDKPLHPRVTTAQRCVRAGGKHNDLENVGYTARHHTFFEMLGNFSFGDYFKRDAIHFAFELLTDKKWFNLDKDRLWVTVYETDNEAYDIWATEVGVPAERIIRIGDNKGGAYQSDNFWQMGDTGPCGPCSEIFYDHGPHVWGGPPGSPEEAGDRYIEIWNLVFMQFNRQADGTLLPLPTPSVDTGMGLERIAAVLQQVDSNYDIDVFKNLIASVAGVVGASHPDVHSLQVIADHIRSCVFLIADGVMPSNEGRGYVLRRIIRRAIRHGYRLGARDLFFYRLVAPLIRVMPYAAAELIHHQQLIEKTLKTEEEQFYRTLERGLALLDEELSQLSGNTLKGETAFRLYDTFGFPLDLTADICSERNIKVDEAGFERAMAAQRERAREAGTFTADYNAMLRVDVKSQFSGYERLEQQAAIIAIFRDGEQVDGISPDENALIILDDTPFYAESGGQVGDTGELVTTSALFKVMDTRKQGQVIAHYGKLVQGSLQVNTTVNAIVDRVRREQICLNHSATHLLHAALRQTLGEEVLQKGSLVNEHYLRFDFSYSQAVTSEQISVIEDRVNTQIRCNLVIQTQVMAREAAIKKGAMALFGEKYDDTVRVLTMGDFSTELCGGTHAKRTGDIGLLRIITESGIAAGIRRIEAVTSAGVMRILRQQSELLQDITQLVKGDSRNLTDKVRATLERNKVLEKELQQLKNKQLARESIALNDKARELKGIKLLISNVDNVGSEMLPAMIDQLKNHLGSAVIVLAGTTDNKVSLAVGVTKNLITKIRANELIAFITSQSGGKGGGRPDLAQAGGVDGHKLLVALNTVEAWVSEKL